MNHQEFSNVLNNMKDLTLKQVFRLFINLKYKTILMLFFIISGVVGGAFTAGKYSHQKDTAVMLESPFSMRLELGDQSIDFENLTLFKDPTMASPYEDKVILSLREIKSHFDIIPVGKVLAQVEDTSISGLWKVFVSSWSLLGHAHADDSYEFHWNGHENDFKFKERFISEFTIHRYYSDGCILEYKVDKNRKSIPKSFVWLKNNH